MFDLLKNEVRKDTEKRKAEARFYIEHGYCEKWAEEHKKDADPDSGARRYCTDTRWEQYKSGKITREKFIDLTIRRMEKQLDAEGKKQIERIAVAEAAPELDFINVNITWRRSRTWGNNPTAYVYTNNGSTTGSASGCGYDKESAAVAEAFNRDPSIMRALYQIKEDGLRAGLTSDSPRTCTGHDNRTICGYGAGYTVLPYFEGGVGVSCFWSILEKAGYKTRGQHGKTEDFYNVYKAEG